MGRQTSWGFVTPVLLLGQHGQQDRSPKQEQAVDLSPTVLAARPQLARALSRWALKVDPDNRFPVQVLNDDPPMLRIHRFLDHSECEALIRQQSQIRTESDLYLNYRVNTELREQNNDDDNNKQPHAPAPVQPSSTSAGSARAHPTSTEAQALNQQWGLTPDVLSSHANSGFRTQIDPASPAFQPILEKVQALMGLKQRVPRFEDGAWVRPSSRSFCVRDQTTVHYRVGEGVSPHVDGKDATVLIYLTGGEDPHGINDAASQTSPASYDHGGSTCFPEIDLCVRPEKGTALLYWSKSHLLHYAEKVRDGDKWICQLLIDFRIRHDEPDIDWQTGTVLSR